MPLTPIETDLIKAQVVEELRNVFDPEIPVNIYDLGLIYSVDVNDTGYVDIEMTLTSPGCPVAGTLPPEVEDRAREVSGVEDVHVELVWEPPWTMERMSDEAKLELGLL